MGLIYRQVKLTGPKGVRTLRALMDTGASESFINAKEARKLGRPFKMPHPMKIELGKGPTAIDQVIFAYIDLDGYRLHWNFYVVPSLTEELILGADFFQRWKIKLDPETERIIVDPKALKVKLV
jgi:predicted aspartyl protease